MTTGFHQVLLNDWRDVARWDTVQVKHVGNGDPDRFLAVFFLFVHTTLLLA
jgi:hypothetical protein